MSELLSPRVRPIRRILAPRVDHAYVTDLAPAYALGAVEPAERVNVDRHLRSCASCAAMVAELEATAGLLPFLAAPAAPSPAAKAALFTRIAHADRAAAAPRAAADVTPPNSTRGNVVTALPSITTLPSSRLGAARSGAANDARPRAKGWLALTTPLATIPLVLALALMGTWAASMRGQIQDQSAEVVGLRQQLHSARPVASGGTGAAEALGIDAIDSEIVVTDETLVADDRDGVGLPRNTQLLTAAFADIGLSDDTASFGGASSTMLDGQQSLPTDGEVHLQ